MKKRPDSNRRSAAKPSPEPKGSKYVLKLYVAGITPRSTTAMENVRRVCQEFLLGRYELEIIDIYQQPKLAEGEQIIAVPTLIKELPVPLRMLIGDMSDKDKLLVGLDLKPIPARGDDEATGGG